jgi:hypothetical protein
MQLYVKLSDLEGNFKDQRLIDPMEYREGSEAQKEQADLFAAHAAKVAKYRAKLAAGETFVFEMSISEFNLCVPRDTDAKVEALLAEGHEFVQIKLTL